MWEIREGGLRFSLSSFPGMAVLAWFFHWFIVDLQHQQAI